MNILVFDTETTGLDPVVDDIIELGFAVFNTETMSVVTAYGTIVGSEVINSAEHVNGISQALQNMGIWSGAGYDLFHSYTRESCEYTLAHNVEFDRNFITKHVKNLDTKWVDSMEFPFPKAGRSRTLSHLAVDHGIVPVGAHRALQDVFILCDLLKTLGRETLEACCADQQKPLWRVIAEVTYGNNHLAKARSFKWNPEGKEWYRDFRGDDKAEVVEKLKAMGASQWDFTMKIRKI